MAALFGYLLVFVHLFPLFLGGVNTYLSFCHLLHALARTSSHLSSLDSSTSLLAHTFRPCPLTWYGCFQFPCLSCSRQVFRHSKLSWDHLASFHSSKVFRFAVKCLPSLVFLPRAAAGTPAVPSLPRLCCHFGALHSTLTRNILYLNHFFLFFFCAVRFHMLHAQIPILLCTVRQQRTNFCSEVSILVRGYNASCFSSHNPSKIPHCQCGSLQVPW